MIRKFANIIVIVMAALMVYGGSGVNVIMYCCDNCKVDVAPVVANTSSCCKHSEADTKSNCCGHQSAASESCCGTETDCCHNGGDLCGLQRVDFEWQTVNVELLSFLPPICIVPQFSQSLFQADIIDLSAEMKKYDDSQSPPPLPKQYLSLLSTLII